MLVMFLGMHSSVLAGAWSAVQLGSRIHSCPASRADPRLPPAQGKGLVWRSGGQGLLPSRWWTREASWAQNSTKVMLEQSLAGRHSVLSLLQLWHPAALGQGHLLSLKSFHLTFAVSNFEPSATSGGENSTWYLCSASCVQSSSQTLTN